MKKLKYSRILAILLPIMIIGGGGIAMMTGNFTQFTAKEAGHYLDDGQFYFGGETGNAGHINYQYDKTAGIQGNELQGNIFIQSVGVGKFDKDAYIDANSVTGKVATRHCWRLKGNISTENAGNIALSGANIPPEVKSRDPNAKTDAFYNPLTRQLEGYGYSENLGKVWLGMTSTDPARTKKKDWTDKEPPTDEYCGVKKEDTKNPDKEINKGVLTNDILNKIIENAQRRSEKQASFIGNVKIIGTAVGNGTIVDDIYKAQTPETYNGFRRVIDNIRQAYFVKARNVKMDDTNTSIVNEVFINQKNPKSTNISELHFVDKDKWEKGKETYRTIVSYGNDIVIGTDITKRNDNKPVAFIALKDEDGKWGNIYITKDVKNIYASLIAEGSIFSGEGQITCNNNNNNNCRKNDKGVIFYNDTASEISTISKDLTKQLYIYGSVMSRNTIGGASKSHSDPIWPIYIKAESDKNDAAKYDFHYFRVFDKDGKNTRSDKHGLDDYSLIIERNPNAISNPPPILDGIR